LTTAAELATALGGTEYASGKWKAHCPAHREKTPSLDITEKNGVPVYHCHGGCNQHAVTEALISRGLFNGTKIRDLGTARTISRPKTGNIIPAPARVEWTPIHPVPADAPPPVTQHYKHGTPAAVYHYRDTAGQLQFLVCRFEFADGSKITPPLTYCQHPTTGKRAWRWLGPRGTRTLYGAELLAQDPTKPVLIVEGEKCKDVGFDTLPNFHTLTWMGGTAGILKSDFTILKDRDVHIWPDADRPGMKAMREIATQIAPFAKSITLHGRIRLNKSMPQIIRNQCSVKGFDLTDCQKLQIEPTETAPTPAVLFLQFSQFLNPSGSYQPLNCRKTAPKTASLLTLPPAVLAPKPAVFGKRQPYNPDRAPMIVALGYDHETYYYLAQEAKQVFALTASSHKPLHFISLVSDQTYWQMEYPKESRSSSGIDWNEAAAKLMSACKQAGPFTPEHIRGRGAWFDDGRIVLHLGDQLIVDGELQPVLSRPGKFVYERAKTLTPPAPEPLTDDESIKVLQIARAFNWRRPVSGTLLSGWLTLAPICGALDWRPHVWITGCQGSGKSWIASNFVHKLVGNMAVYIKGGCSEAGIRQTIRTDALPIIFDEAEGEDARDHGRIRTVLQLMRQASSEIGGRVVKGSASGNATFFDIRSMFCLIAIGVTLEAAADKSRCAVLELGAGYTGSRFDVIREGMKDFTPEYAARLFARTVSLIPVIRENALILAREVAEVFGSQRMGDQYGTLLAGAWSLLSSERITQAAAKDYVASFDWAEQSADIQERDEDICLQRIVGSSIKVEMHAGSAVMRTVGELIARVSLQAGVKDSRMIHVEDADMALRRHGLRVDRAGGFLYIANSHPELKRLMADTSWAAGYHRTLQRMEGATAADPRPFAPGTKYRATRIPLSCVAWGGGDGENENLERDGVPF
jgi:putative DNA primase/helicase